MINATSPVAPPTVDAATYPWYADGRWRDAPAVFDDFEPFSGALYAQAPNCGPEEARLAITAAYAAFPAWANTPPVEKARLFLMDRRIEEAVKLGATLHTGGTHDDLVYQPTILTDVPYEATVSNEETFGPLVIEDPVDTPAEAVAVANRVQYGLSSSILAGDTYKAFELAPQILHGIVNVNSPTVNDEIHAPMGGVRDSGCGRTGPDSLADFTDVIWINTTSSERQFPF